MSKAKNRAIIVCGPTASGKTEFAHKMALQNNAEIVNADSMQIYKQIPIITASPTIYFKNELPYHLYNFQDIDKEFSAAKYTKYASTKIKEITAHNKLPIIVGGSGMYINMLIHGYSQIPDINPQIRIDARNLHAKIGSESFFHKLVKLDPKIKHILNHHDQQRIIRAYEVIKQTGKSILYFQDQPNIKPLESFKFEILLLSPERQTLYERCNSRLVEIFENGAIDEVRNLHQDYGNIKISAMKALGVPEIISYIKKEITYDTAIELASRRTRKYVKRQITWFKNQLNNYKLPQDTIRIIKI